MPESNSRVCGSGSRIIATHADDARSCPRERGDSQAKLIGKTGAGPFPRERGWLVGPPAPVEVELSCPREREWIALTGHALVVDHVSPA